MSENKEKKENKRNPLTVTICETKKHNIKVTPYQEAYICPPHPSSIVFNGRSGSGKTNLLAFLMTNRDFYGEYFDNIYLFAGSPDDSFKSFGIADKHTFKKPKQWNSNIKKILKANDAIIDQIGIDKAPKLLFIFEDIINYATWMRTSSDFTRLFISGRHSNASVFITTQSWTKLPRAIRLQAIAVYYFKASFSERMLLSEEWGGFNMSTREFADKIMDNATKEPFNFLSIYTRLPEDRRYRKNLDQIYNA